MNRQIHTFTYITIRITRTCTHTLAHINIDRTYRSRSDGRQTNSSPPTGKWPWHSPIPNHFPDTWHSSSRNTHTGLEEWDSTVPQRRGGPEEGATGGRGVSLTLEGGWGVLGWGWGRFGGVGGKGVEGEVDTAKYVSRLSI